MKQTMILLLLSTNLIIAKAQNFTDTNGRQSNGISITTTKTSNLVFTEPVVHVDRGTSDILVAQVKEAGNILLVKAAKSNIEPTNLSVITRAGTLYNIRIHYESDPKQLVYQFTEAMADAGGAKTSEGGATQHLSLSAMKAYATAIQAHKRVVHGIKGKERGVVATLNGIYHKEGIFFFQIVLKNHTAIDYDVEGSRIYITDRKRLRRTATQEQPITPLLVIGDKGLVKAGSQKVMVWAVNKVLPPVGSVLTIELTEKDGTGALRLKVPTRKILQSALLTNLPLTNTN